ncbi:hypothetical protein LR69_01330 [Geobacillus sp. BCO2]|nr:hypothetical protein LR69_01330 [Geobacillus sp. BCO2]
MNIDDPKCIHAFDTELASSALLMLPSPLDDWITKIEQTANIIHYIHTP